MSTLNSQHSQHTQDSKRSPHKQHGGDSKPTTWLQYFAMKGLLFGSLVVFLFYLYFAAIDLTDIQQGVLAWLLLAIIFVLSRVHSVNRHLMVRIAFLLIAAFITLRYLIWRATSTLVYTGPVDFFFMSLLYVAELEVALVYIINMFTNVYPLERPEVKLPDDQATWPTVDVFLPTYTEDPDLVRITATAAAQIDYPKDKINIYILDDGSTEQRCQHPQLGPGAHHRRRKLKAVAERLGIGYIARKENTHAKAGNINYALSQTQGDIVLVLDCDHVPAHDILQHTVGWFFTDPKLCLVQTPHFFINPDPLEKNLGSFHKAPSENEMFYRGIQPAIDFWDATFFCGSAALLRRSALDEVGGIVGETITEDCETSINLHALGYHSVYVSRPMVCGLSPETFEDFLLQRTRWCQGMVQMFFLNNATFKAGLSLSQRICYTSFYMYWFFGFARFMFFVAPSLYLLFGIQIYHASLQEALVYVLPHIFGSLVTMRYLFGKYRWPLFSELYESVQGLFLLPAVIGVVENPRAPTFKVTPKGKTLDNDYLSPLAGPFYLMFAIMLLSIPTAIYEWVTNPYAQDGIIICLVWLTINLVLTFSALGVFWERQQVRTYPRAWANNVTGVLDKHGNELATGRLHDLSMSGVGMVAVMRGQLEVGEEYIIKAYSSAGRMHRLRVRLKFQKPVKEGVYCGMAFINMEEHYDELVSLVYGDSQRWVDFWNRQTAQPSLFDIAQLFLKMGLYGVSHSVTGMASLIRYYGTLLSALWRHLSERMGQYYIAVKSVPQRERRKRRDT